MPDSGFVLKPPAKNILKNFQPFAALKKVGSKEVRPAPPGGGKRGRDHRPEKKKAGPNKSQLSGGRMIILPNIYIVFQSLADGSNMWNLCRHHFSHCKTGAGIASRTNETKPQNDQAGRTGQCLWGRGPAIVHPRGGSISSFLGVTHFLSQLLVQI